MHLTKASSRWERLPGSKPTVLYDLTVEVEPTGDPELDDLNHNYLANGILVSNSHFKLAEPMPNPLFERAIKALTGLTAENYEGLLSGKLAVSKDDGQLVADEGQEGLVRGGYAFEYLLGRINRDKELDEILNSTATARGQKLDDLVKKAKILRALKKANMQPTVYLQRNLAILPPQFRPITITGSGDISYDDLNGIYKAVALDNTQLKEFPQGLPESEKGSIRAELYDGLKSLAGMDGSMNREQDIKGVLDIIHGSELKYGYFQKMLMKRRQDMTARGVVIPDMEIGLEELGIPKKTAKTLFEPFVVRELTQPPYSMSVADARQALKDEREAAMRVLDKVMGDRPLAMKRDPVLHKHNIQGFYAKIVPGHAMHVNPLVTTGFNMDFDGDQASLYVPVTPDAVEDVKNMMPTNILRAPTSGSLAYVAKMEVVLGLYQLSKVGKATDQSFKTEADLLAAYKDGKVEQSDIVRVGGKATTAGRAIVASALPEGDLRDNILHDMTLRLDKSTVSKMLTSLAADPKVFKSTAQKLGKIGFVNATMSGGSSVSLKDFAAVTAIRDKIFQKADAEADAIPKTAKDREARIVEIYSKASEDIKKSMQAELSGSSNRLWEMVQSGAMSKGDSLRQLVSTPVLVQSGAGGAYPVPIRHSYSEGLDSAEYWVASHGARKGMYDRTQEASLPGAINKQLTNAAMNVIISEPDCQTKQALHRPVEAGDLLDRYTAETIQIGKRVIPKNTLITSQIVSELKKAKKTSVAVRSPMRCAAHNGICQKCYGLGPDGKPPKVGENVGVVAAQALGERGTQLALSSFHSAGAVGKKSVINSIGRVRQIVAMPEILSESATLAMESGVVTKVEKDPVGGFRVWVGQTDHYVPHGLDVIVKKGDKIQRGKPLTKGVINPHELLTLSGVNAVQNYMAEAIDELYGKEGVKRVHPEVLVRTLTGLAKVVDPGDNEDLLPNDMLNAQTLEAWNAEHKGAKPVKYDTVLKGVDVLPLEQTEDWLARLAYRRPSETIRRGTVEGWKSDIHGTHPIPGAVYGAEFGKPPKGGKGPY